MGTINAIRPDLINDYSKNRLTTTTLANCPSASNFTNQSIFISDFGTTGAVRYSNGSTWTWTSQPSFNLLSDITLTPAQMGVCSFFVGGVRYISDGLSFINHQAEHAAMGGFGAVASSYYFHGFAGLQYSDDPAFYDISGTGNDGVFGANLSKASAWANSSYISTLDPAAGTVDTSIKIPALNFDYSAGESLLIFWSGTLTPEVSDTTMMGNSMSSSTPGIRVRCKTDGTLNFVVYGAGAVSKFSATTTVSAAGKPFVADEKHTFMIWINGAEKKHAIWVDSIINVSYQTLGDGLATDTKSSNVWVVGSGSSTSTEGAAVKTRALAILRFAAGASLPTVSTLTNINKQLISRPHMPLASGVI